MDQEAREAAWQIATTAPELSGSLVLTANSLVETVTRARPTLTHESMKAAAEAVALIEEAAKAVDRLRSSIEESERNRTSFN